MASDDTQDDGRDERRELTRRLCMRAGAAESADLQIAKLTATIVFTLVNTGQVAALGAVGASLRACLGLDRAWRTWDTATCMLDPDTDWQMVEVTEDGE
jgi:hypothetical protein